MMAVVLATGAVLFARKIGFGAAEVRAFYLGSPSGFTPARSLPGLLEVAVPHLLAIPMAVLVTLHLAAFATAARARPFSALAAITYGCAAAAIGSSMAASSAARAASPAFPTCRGSPSPARRATCLR